MTAPSSPFKTCLTVFLVTSRTISVLNSNFNCNKIFFTEVSTVGIVFYSECYGV
jgi:hypothetical protein